MQPVTPDAMIIAASNRRNALHSLPTGTTHTPRWANAATTPGCGFRLVVRPRQDWQDVVSRAETESRNSRRKAWEAHIQCETITQHAVCAEW